jgi:hypothetical protein
MKNGFVIIVKDYKAEICEFTTLTVITMPDGSKLYFVHTKYGDEYFKEMDLRANRSELEKECEAMNKALGGLNGRNKGSYHKIR